MNVLWMWTGHCRRAGRDSGQPSDAQAIQRFLAHLLHCMRHMQQRPTDAAAYAACSGVDELKTVVLPVRDIQSCLHAVVECQH